MPGIDPIDGLKALIGHPDHGSKHWVYEQYDTQVMADTVRRPGLGAGVIRVHGTDKALAFTADVNPCYVRANPVEGGKQAVAEAYRNLSAVGARPLAATDNLNFGNPEKPEIMGQLVGAIEGIGAACRALDMPIVSGNVSLYNETDGQPILPTPTIGAVGLLDHLDDLIGGQPRGRSYRDGSGRNGRTSRPIGPAAQGVQPRGRRRAPCRPRRRTRPWGVSPRETAR